MTNALSSCLNLNTSEIVAVCSLLVAACAFFATFWQACIARKHARLSVKPHLDQHESHLSTKPFSICIVNMGLGPAIVDHILVGMNGLSPILQDETYQSTLSKLTSGFASSTPTYMMISTGTPIQVGQSIELVSFEVDFQDMDKRKQAENFSDGFSFEVRYRSMYDEPFVYNRASK
jgi:hypothetical protein